MKNSEQQIARLQFFEMIQQLLSILALILLLGNLFTSQYIVQQNKYNQNEQLIGNFVEQQFGTVIIQNYKEGTLFKFDLYNLPQNQKFEVVILQNIQTNQFLRFNPFNSKQNNCEYRNQSKEYFVGDIGIIHTDINGNSQIQIYAQYLQFKQIIGRGIAILKYSGNCQNSQIISLNDIISKTFLQLVTEQKIIFDLNINEEMENIKPRFVNEEWNEFQQFKKQHNLNDQVDNLQLIEQQDQYQQIAQKNVKQNLNHKKQQDQNQDAIILNLDDLQKDNQQQLEFYNEQIPIKLKQNSIKNQKYFQQQTNIQENDNIKDKSEELQTDNKISKKQIKIDNDVQNQEKKQSIKIINPIKNIDQISLQDNLNFQAVEIKNQVKKPQNISTETSTQTNTQSRIKDTQINDQNDLQKNIDQNSKFELDQLNDSQYMDMAQPKILIKQNELSQLLQSARFQEKIKDIIKTKQFIFQDRKIEEESNLSQNNDQFELSKNKKLLDDDFQYNYTNENRIQEINQTLQKIQSELPKISQIIQQFHNESQIDNEQEYKNTTAIETEREKIKQAVQQTFNSQLEKSLGANLINDTLQTIQPQIQQELNFKLKTMEEQNNIKNIPIPVIIKKNDDYLTQKFKLNNPLQFRLLQLDNQID